ncbi:hypothetical protein [Staphylospora marina]|uniref:hypothetical protein n=1 Tax=Staphylospora marina TaxID=2490858 RepID=UPI000F5BFEE0|nr:hypothetical protein [Staphylospora marina]
MSGKPYEFVFDERLGVLRPLLHVDYESMTESQQQDFELGCQEVLAAIPEKIRDWETEYLHRFEQLQTAEDDRDFVRLSEELNRISSILSDLNLLYLHIEGNYLGANVTA